MTTEGRFCPTCGTKRTGFFRFCASCGFDFDELAARAPTPTFIAPGQVALPQMPAAPPAPAWPRAPVWPPPDSLPAEPERAEPELAQPELAQPEPAPPAPAPSHSLPLERLAPAQPPILDAVTTDRPAATMVEPRSRERTIVRIAIVGLAGLLALSAISNAINQRRSSGTAGPTVALGSPLVVDSPGPQTSLPSTGATFAPKSETQFAVVSSVTDGDTIRVVIDGQEYPLRYIGIDAPESNAYDPTVKGLADAATEANRRLVEGQDVFLEREVSDTDQFDRLLRDVWLIGSEGEYVLVNLELVRGGLAQVTTLAPDERYEDQLLRAQDSARTAELGLWAPAASAGSSPAAVPPAATPVTLVGGGQSGCHPSYSPCLPIVADLDCAEVRAMGAAPVSVKGPDDYELDAEDDGLGCE